MRGAGEVALIGAGGDYSEIPIDLHGIGIYDTAIEALSQINRQSRLAAGRWACDEES